MNDIADDRRSRILGFASAAPSHDTALIAPTEPDAVRLVLIVLAGFAGGVVNSIAGGGTLVTFPALVAFGIPALTANATSTVALWPGAISSMWGYRELLRGMERWVVRFALPSLFGGLVGALLLLRTPAERFERLVPWLVLSATFLFLIQRPAIGYMRNRARLRRGSRTAEATDRNGALNPSPWEPSPAPAPSDDAIAPTGRLLLFQFAVAVYGGYFGAGIGILMLAALGLMGFSNIHRMNGLKNWGGLCANAVAALTFSMTGLVDWPVAIAMASGATFGGYVASRVAQRVSQESVRKAIVMIGLASGIWMLVR